MSHPMKWREVLNYDTHSDTRFFFQFVFFFNNTLQYLEYITYTNLSYNTRYSTYNKLLTRIYLQYTTYSTYRQCGRVVRAPDLKSGGSEFKSRSDRYLELFHGRPGFISSTTLVNSQLVCLLPVGIFNLLCLV